MPAARVVRPNIVVLVDGDATMCTEVHTNHSTDQPVGTCSLVIPTPGGVRPVNVAREKVVEVLASVTVDGVTESGRIFHGMVRPERNALDETGSYLTAKCSGWNFLLSLPQRDAIAFTGPILASDVDRGLYRLRGFDNPDVAASYDVHDILDVDGNPITLGNTTTVNNGQVIVPSAPRTSPLTMIVRIANLFRYKAFDRPNGRATVMRVNGRPPTDPGGIAAAFVEGVDPFRVDGDADPDQIVNYWTVRGASGTDADGNKYAYASTPATIPPNDDVPNPPGEVAGEITDDLLDTDDLCAAARRAMELDYGDLAIAGTWTTWLRPALQPGDVVTIQSPGAAFDDVTYLWVLGVQHDYTAEDATTTITAWAGTGTVLPSADGCTSATLGAGPYHVGDESISWYAIPDPTDHEIAVDFTLPADYTSARIVARAHGCNSYFLDGGDSSSGVSRFEIRQGTEVKSSGTMPMVPENYAAELDYTNDANWTDISVPMSGQLPAGDYTLHILSGYDDRANLGPWDDFEVKGIVLTTCGLGIPDLPGTPNIPPVVPKPTSCIARSDGGTVTGGLVGGLFLPAFTIPAHTRYVILRFYAYGLTGEEDPLFSGNPANDRYAKQYVDWITNGGRGQIFPIGTQDLGTAPDYDVQYASAGSHTSDWAVGTGLVEHVWDFSNLTSPLDFPGGDDLYIGTTGPAFSVSGVCLSVVLES